MNNGPQLPATITSTQESPAPVGDTDQVRLRPSQDSKFLGELGTFRVKEKIGEGGMGWVFFAEDPILQRKVALKVMRPGLAADSGATERFLREARSAAAIAHDNIIPIYQVGDDNGVIFIAMPLLQGQTLGNRMRDSTPVPLDLIFQVGRETASGLAAAHACDLLHRDIKPANLWLEELPGRNPSVRVKILDFGLARPVADDGVSLAGRICGTPGYMSPEQINGDPLDARTDLFSLGCVLYQMATGKSPFAGKSTTAKMRATAEDHPPPPAELRREIPLELSRLIVKLMAKNRDDRPANASEVAETVARIQNGQSESGHTITYSTRSSLSRANVMRRTTVALAAAVILTASAILLRPVFQGSSPSAGPTHSATSLGTELDLRVWKKADETRMRSLADPGVLPLEAGDYAQVFATAKQPTYFYVVQIESSGRISPLYLWKNYDWNQRRPEEALEVLRVPDDPKKNAAPLTASPAGIEVIFLLAREQPLATEDLARLPAIFADFPPPNKADLVRGAIWLSDREPARFSREDDRGRLELGLAKALNDPIERVRTLLGGDLPKMFAESRAVCYPFQSP